MGRMGGSGRVGRRLEGEKLYEFALRALGRRSHTESEIRTKLERKCRSPGEVEGILDRLRGHGYLDDVRVAESYAIFRRDDALLGRRRVLEELRRRGVADSLARSAVDDAYRVSDEADLAAAFVRKKLGERSETQPLEAPKQILRLYRALVRAGHSADAIDSALRAVARNDELLDQLAEATASADPAD